jgi:hypothetical protein
MAVVRSIDDRPSSAADAHVPYNLDAERAVLGAILVNADAFSVAAALQPRDFFRDAHQRLFKAMLTLKAADTPIDFVLLCQELARSGDLDEVGPAYIASLSDGVPRSTNIKYYADIVRRDAERRDLARVAAKLRARACSDQDVAAAVADAQADLATVRARSVGPGQLRVFTMPELAAYQFQHRRALLSRNGVAVLREGDLVQVYAARGVGKTWFTLTLALVAATGTDAMGFSAVEPCRVLNIDGEMASEDVQERLQRLAFAVNVSATENLTIVAADWQEGILPRLDTSAGQAAVEPFVNRADLIVIDNRSTLFDPEAETDPLSWQSAQNWLLSLRRRGKGVIVVHHANRQGGARGHSRPEDVLNLSVKLTRPDDYSAEHGARFKVEFDKTRGVHGPAVASFTTCLSSTGWEIEDVDSGNAGVTRKLKMYLRRTNNAQERPKSASTAIRGAHVNKEKGLDVWGELLQRGEIRKLADGSFALADDED